MQNAPPALAVARAGVDPLLVEGAIDEAAERGLYAPNAPRTKSTPSSHEIVLGATGSGAIRSHHRSPPA